MAPGRAKVAFVKCASYADDVRARVEELLAHLGGIGAFVEPGETVLVKPNMLTDGTPDQAKTTHPEVVRAILRILKDHGARPSVGDSPSTVTKLERVWDRTGFRALCEEEAVPLLNLEKAGSETFELEGITFSVAKPVLAADKLIGVPKLKTHSLTMLTAAVKNMYGTVPGYQKAILHEKHPSPRGFGKLLALLYGKVRPVLSVLDAVVGMEGNGPAAGDPVPLGFLAASADAAALDATVCRVLGGDPRRVPYLQEVADRGLGSIRADRIELAGVPPAEIRPGHFRWPGTSFLRWIPTPLVRLVQPLFWIRPAISDKCVGCGRCVAACPRQALTMGPDKRPVLEPRACIQCCCCHEVCAERAITMKASPLIRPFLSGD